MEPRTFGSATDQGEGARDTGIAAVGDMPWGTHFCHFYGDRSDLVEIVVPYFRAGLDGNEFCMWLTCEPCDADQARQELRRVFPDADRRLDAGDIEIVPSRDWYLTNGCFDPERVIAGWGEKLSRALARGYTGMRVHANEAWLTPCTWDAFAGYEDTLNDALAGRRMIVLCTYPLEGSSGKEIFDVAGTHHFAITRRRGEWEVLESVELMAATAEIQRLNRELEARVQTRTRELAEASAALRESEELYRLLAENTNDLLMLHEEDGPPVYVSPSFARLLGEVPGTRFRGVHPDDQPALKAAWTRILAGERAFLVFRHAHADGSWRWLEAWGIRVLYKGRPHVLSVSRDVTDRTRAEKALRENEELFRLLTENSSDLITLRTLDGDAVYGSPSFVRVVGLDPGESLELVIERFHPDDRELGRQAWATVVGGEPVNTTFRYRHANGSWLWMEALGMRVEYQGEPHVLSVTRDITDRKRSEQAHLWFLESMDRISRAIQGTTDLEQMLGDVLDTVMEILDGDQAGLMYPCDLDAPVWTVPMSRSRPEFAAPLAGEPIVRQTDEARRMVRLLRATDGPVQFGPEPEQQPLPDILGHCGIRSTMSMAVYPKVDRPYLLAISQCRYPRVWTPEEMRLWKELGRRLGDGLTSLTLLRSLRASEREVRVSEARFRIFVDHAADAFFLHDEMGIILDVNAQACESLGYTREELVGLSPRDFDVEADDSRYDDIGTRLAAGELVAFDTRHRRRDGTEFPVEVRARPFTEWGRSFAVSLVRDITDRKRLEEQFQHSHKMEAIGRLAGGVAHDFNNLLTAIIGYSELVLYDLPEGSAPAADVGEIRLAAERARGVTRQLLAFSRRQVLQLQVIDVGAVVRGIERMLRLLLREDVQFEVRTCRRPLWINADPIQIEQVLMNLVVNARDAIGSGGQIVLEASYLDGARRGGEVPDFVRPVGYARIVVSDTGTGMTPEIASRVFEPFFSTKPAGIGTGLGLSTVYGIVKQSDGYIWVESEPDRGATFTVLLPITAEGPPPGAELAPPRAHELDGMSVVVVEDEDAVRNFIVDTLRRSGVEVLDFATPAAAMTVLGDPDRRVDALVTDVILPGMSGPEMVERIRPTRPRLGVVYMSGYSAEEAAFADLLREAPILEKPFGADDLLARVSAAGG